MNEHHRSADLLDRLSSYRTTLDDAIAGDATRRSEPDNPVVKSHHRAMLRAAVAVLLIAGIGVTGWLSTRPDDAESLRDSGPSASTAPASIDTVTTSDPATSAATPTLPADWPRPDNTGGFLPIGRIAIGDQVMLGAAPDLFAQGWIVDAEVSRQASEVVPIVEQLGDQGRLGETVVIHVGTNGTISPEDLAAIMTALSSVPDVQVLTVAVDRDWATGNNDLIRQLPAQFPNVSVIDWAELSKTCPGDCFYEDGFHLRPDGQRFYEELINTATAPN